MKPKKWEYVYPHGTKEGDEELAFFIALARNSKYQWRSTSALSKEAGLTRERVEEIIQKYYKKGMVFQNPKNEDQWGYWERVPEMLPKPQRSISQKDHEDRMGKSAKYTISFDLASKVTQQGESGKAYDLLSVDTLCGDCSPGEPSQVFATNCSAGQLGEVIVKAEEKTTASVIHVHQHEPEHLDVSSETLKVYAVPLTNPPVILDINTFYPRKGILTRYGKKLLKDGAKFHSRLATADFVI